MSGLTTRVGLLGLLLLASPVLAGPEADSPVFGLVIGHNGTDDPKVARLRYADDDAVKNARLLAELGAPGGFVLLTRLDAESAALYPDAKPTEPTRRAVEQAMAMLNQRMAAAREKGQQPVFYLFYSGHGDVENNRGYVHLEDARWWRDDLLALLADSRATTNHLIIDACKSYFLVFDRGAGGERQPLSDHLLDSPTQLPAHTGVFLSTSSAADSHEWEAFQAGVFSHELRSALRGAADANADGAVSYEEAAAFVWIANQAIINRRYRPAFYTRPPKGAQEDRATVLLDLRSSRGDRLLIGPGVADHLYVEDGQGIRLADLHPDARQRVALALPRRRPLFLRRPGDGQEFILPAGSVDLAELQARPASVGRRGAEHEAFRSLFSSPFGPGAIQAYRTRPDEEVTAFAGPTDWTWVRRSVGIAAIAFGVTGGTMTGLAWRERDTTGPATTGLERARSNDRIGSFNTAAVTCYALAGAALAGYLLWTFWPEEEVPVEVVPLGGASMGLGVRF